MSEKEQPHSNQIPEDVTIDWEGIFEKFLRFLELFWKHKKKIFMTVFVTMVAAGVLSLLVSNKYVAVTTILPDIELLNAAQKLGSLQQLAASFDVTAGVTSPSQLYPTIILSETVLKPVIYYKYNTEKYDTVVNLIQYYEFDDEDENKNYEESLELMREKVISLDVDGETFVITMEVETTEPQLSADVANQIIIQLDTYQRKFRSMNASEQRRFLEGRLEEVKKDLTKAEEALKNFREKNRKIIDSPELLLEQARLQREVDLNSTLYIELKKQYELVKLEEVKNTPVVQVLDAARPPAEESSPKRAIIVLVAGFMSLVFSTVWFVTSAYLLQYSGQNNAAARMLLLLNELRNDTLTMLPKFFRRNLKQPEPDQSS